MNVNIVCIVKNENKYIDEWLRYHTHIGFTHFYIYDNSEENDIVIQHAHRSQVTVTHFPGTKMQNSAYTHYDHTYGTPGNWSMALDIDEFLVVKKYNNVEQYIERLISRNINCVGINWKIFGSSNHIEYTNAPVVARFQKCQLSLDQHIKTLYSNNINPSQWACPHHPEMVTNIHSTGGTIINDNLPFAPETAVRTDPDIYIAHYFCKSKQEWIEKRARGRADTGTVRNDTDFEMMDSNDMVNDTVNVLYQNILVEK